VLTITAKVNVDVPEGYRLFYSEYGIGDYKRSFELGNEIDQDKIEATVKKWNLKITFTQNSTHCEKNPNQNPIRRI
jgi:HSP20 family protein